MNMYPENFRYTKEHEWVNVEGDTGTVGITDHAQKELGDIVYVDLPKPGATAEKGKVVGSVESVKAVSDIYSPVSGEVTAVNDLLADFPLISADFIRSQVTPSAELRKVLRAFEDHLERAAGAAANHFVDGGLGI